MACGAFRASISRYGATGWPFGDVIINGAGIAGLSLAVTLKFVLFPKAQCHNLTLTKNEEHHRYHFRSMSAIQKTLFARLNAKRAPSSTIRSLMVWPNNIGTSMSLEAARSLVGYSQDAVLDYPSRGATCRRFEST